MRERGDAGKEARKRQTPRIPVRSPPALCRGSGKNDAVPPLRSFAAQ